MAFGVNIIGLGRTTLYCDSLVGSRFGEFSKLGRFDFVAKTSPGVGQNWMEFWRQLRFFIFRLKPNLTSPNQGIWSYVLYGLTEDPPNTVR